MPKVVTIVGFIIFVLAAAGCISLIVDGSEKRDNLQTLEFLQYVTVAGAVLAGAGVVADAIRRSHRAPDAFPAQYSPVAPQPAPLTLPQPGQQPYGG